MSRVLVKRALTPHPDTPEGAFSLGVKVSRFGAEVLKFEFVVIGPIDALVLPAGSLGERASELWKTTCFEAFLKPVGSAGYLELNISPSSQWAAYDFAGYRDAMADALDVTIDSHCSATGGSRMAMTAYASGPRFADLGNAGLGLSAILEHTDGNKSYWALAHPPGQPDFHDPACFAATIPATGAA